MNPVFSFKNQTDNNESEDIDIPIFDLSTIANATDNFSVDNKLGQGGFGPVYKVWSSYFFFILTCHWCEDLGQSCGWTALVEVSPPNYVFTIH